MSLSIFKALKDVANAIKGFPKFSRVSEDHSFTSSTSFADTGARVSVPANSYVCVTGVAVWAHSKPAMIQLRNSADSNVLSESAVARNNAATTLSFFTDKACSIVVYAQYSGAAQNIITLSGFIITFGGGTA